MYRSISSVSQPVVGAGRSAAQADRGQRMVDTGRGAPVGPRVRVMDFLLLGDVEVRAADVGLVALGARQRAVLAVLLYRANAVVARSEIVRLVWGPQPA